MMICQVGSPPATSPPTNDLSYYLPTAPGATWAAVPDPRAENTAQPDLLAGGTVCGVPAADGDSMPTVDSVRVGKFDGPYRCADADSVGAHVEACDDRVVPEPEAAAALGKKETPILKVGSTNGPPATIGSAAMPDPRAENTAQPDLLAGDTVRGRTVPAADGNSMPPADGVEKFDCRSVSTCTDVERVAHADACNVGSGCDGCDHRVFPEPEAAAPSGARGCSGRQRAPPLRPRSRATRTTMAPDCQGGRTI